MLMIETQPSGFAVHPLGIPIEWTVYDPDRVENPGRNARWDFLVTENTANEGETFTIGGVQFSVDNSVPYTATTFARGPILIATARNFADMLKSNYRWIDYTIEYVTVDGQSARRVSIVARQPGPELPDNAGGDTSGLSGIGLSFIDGEDRTIIDRRLWFQFWTGDTPIGDQRPGYFDQSGRVVINGQKAARGIVRSSNPDLNQTDPEIDQPASAPLYLKLGTYNTGGDCTPAFGQVFETSQVTVADLVLQHETTANGSGFGGFVQLPRWLTGRPNRRGVRRQGYEWTATYLSETFIQGAAYQITRTFYDVDDNEVGQLQEEILERGLLRIPTGYQNGVPEAYGEVARMTVQIGIQLGFGFTPAGEPLELTFIDDDCVAAQVFYLEERGSWRTIYFDQLDERRLEVAATDLLTAAPTGSHLPLGADEFAYRTEGGRDQAITQVDATFVLATDLVTERRRKEVEEMLSSPRHFILSSSEGGPILRRVLFDRSGYQTYQRANPSRIQVPFRFNDPKRSR